MYYGEVNLKDNGICVIRGSLVPKALLSPLYLVNPIEPELNAGKIVHSTRLNDFQNKCKEAVNYLNKTTDTFGRRNTDFETWGLVGLCHKNSDLTSRTKSSKSQTKGSRRRSKGSRQVSVQQHSAKATGTSSSKEGDTVREVAEPKENQVLKTV